MTKRLRRNALSGGRLGSRGCLLPLFSVPADTSAAAVSCRRAPRHQPRHSQQVVGGPHEVGPEACPLHAAVARLPQAADRLPPAEDLLDLLATPLAELVARLTQGAPVE